MVGVEVKNWKFVTVDCWKMHLRAPEQLKMTLKNLPSMIEIFNKSYDVVLKLRENRKQT